MKFNELSDKDKIRHIKDKYAEIIGEIVLDRANLDKLVPMPKDEPVLVKPNLLPCGGEEINSGLLKKAEEEFAAKHKEYSDIKNMRVKILETLSKIKEKEDCICEPRELDIDINYIVPEFEIFIEFARKRAEALNY